MFYSLPNPHNPHHPPSPFYRQPAAYPPSQPLLYAGQPVAPLMENKLRKLTAIFEKTLDVGDEVYLCESDPTRALQWSHNVSDGHERYKDGPLQSATRFTYSVTHNTDQKTFTVKNPNHRQPGMDYYGFSTPEKCFEVARCDKLTTSDEYTWNFELILKGKWKGCFKLVNKHNNSVLYGKLCDEETKKTPAQPTFPVHNHAPPFASHPAPYVPAYAPPQPFAPSYAPSYAPAYAPPYAPSYAPVYAPPQLFAPPYASHPAPFVHPQQAAPVPVPPQPHYGSPPLAPVHAPPHRPPAHGQAYAPY